MKLRFSSNPGCWERHLQRKHNNPLFDSPQITQEQVELAQKKDEAERQIFLDDFHHLLEEVIHLKDRVSPHVVLKLKQRIDGLYEKCAGLGSDFNLQKHGLCKLNELIMQSVLESNLNDAETIEVFKREEAARQLHFSLLEHPFVAHLLHPNKPIAPDEIVPALLTEDELPLRAAMSLFNTEHQRFLCYEARKLLTRLKEEGNDLPIAWMHLSIMEQPLYRPN